MGDGQEVEVLPGPGRGDRSEPQAADREGSVARSGVAELQADEQESDTGHRGTVKSVGGVREWGIPTVLDRFIQPAMQCAKPCATSKMGDARWWTWS